MVKKLKLFTIMIMCVGMTVSAFAESPYDLNNNGSFGIDDVIVLLNQLAQKEPVPTDITGTWYVTSEPMGEFRSGEASLQIMPGGLLEGNAMLTSLPGASFMTGSIMRNEFFLTLTTEEDTMNANGIAGANGYTAVGNFYLVSNPDMKIDWKGQKITSKILASTTYEAAFGEPCAMYSYEPNGMTLLVSKALPYVIQSLNETTMEAMSMSWTRSARNANDISGEWASTQGNIEHLLTIVPFGQEDTKQVGSICYVYRQLPTR